MKIVFALLGLVFTALGAVGVALPVLPTTPFLLLASACFMRSSTRFQLWFVSTRLYRRCLRSFVENRAMTMRGKLSILLPVTLLFAVVFVLQSSLPGRIAIAVVIAVKWYYFLHRIKTIPSGDGAAAEPEQ